MKQRENIQKETEENLSAKTQTQRSENQNVHENLKGRN